MKAQTEKELWQEKYDANLARATAKPLEERVAWTKAHLPGPRKINQVATTATFGKNPS